MGKAGKAESLRILPDYLAAGIIAALIIGVTVAHYLTPHSLHYLHGIYRRVYYIPIIITALQFGLYEALAVSTVVTLCYIPHAFFGTLMDPGTTEEKILEIVLYFAVASVTGMMQQRLRREVARREETERMLRLKDRLTSLGELSAGFAHEIRNPTASIKGAAQLLQEYLPEDDGRKKIASLLVKESDRLEETVGKFLGFARPSVSVTEGLAVGELLSETVELLKNHQDAAGKEIRLDPGSQQARVAGDSTLLKQVFFNIGLNALQSMREGGVLSIEMGREEGRWAISFRDTGAGMDADALERIFDPFYTTKEKGMGLGLSVSYSIVQEHKGDIAVMSRKGEGSTFTVLLPGRAA